MWTALTDRNFIWSFSSPYQYPYTLDNNAGSQQTPRKGMAIGFHIIRLFQNIICQNYQLFLKLDENGQPLDYTQIDDEADWHWDFDSFKEAFGRPDATSIEEIFRRYVDNPSWAGGTEEYGMCSLGDCSGPWLWEDLAKCLSLLYVMDIDTYTTDTRTDVRLHEGYAINSDYSSAITDCITNFNSTNIGQSFDYPHAYSAVGDAFSSYKFAKLSITDYYPYFQTLTRLDHIPLFNEPYDAEFKILVFVKKPDSRICTSSTYIYDDNGTGFTENKWNLVQTKNITNMDASTTWRPYYPEGKYWISDEVVGDATVQPNFSNNPTAPECRGWMADKTALIMKVNWDYLTYT